MIGRLLARAASPLPPDVSAVATSSTTGGLAAIASWQGWPGYTSDGFPSWLATEANVVGIPVVAGFLGILTSLILQMPLHAYRDTGDPTTTGERIEPDPPILRNPAPGGNRVLGDWIGEYVHDAVLFGNYVGVLGAPSRTGWPDTLYPVPYEQWRVTDNPTQPVLYWVGVPEAPYLPGEVFHVRRNTRTGQLVGAGLVNAPPDVLVEAIQLGRWTGAYYASGAVPPAQVSHPDPDLTQAQADDLKTKWNAAVRRREVVVTPAGTDVHVLTSDAEGAQLSQTRRVISQELAMLLGIPAALLGLDSPSLTYRNITDVFTQFVTTTVMGYLAPVEQQLSAQCLPRGFVARFDTNAVLRPDLAARVHVAVEGVAGGILTADEARRLVGVYTEPVDPAAPDVQPAPVVAAPVAQPAALDAAPAGG